MSHAFTARSLAISVISLTGVCLEVLSHFFFLKKSDCENNTIADRCHGFELKSVVGPCGVSLLFITKWSKPHWNAGLQICRIKHFCRFIVGPVGGLILIVNKPRTISSVCQRAKQHFVIFY